MSSLRLADTIDRSPAHIKHENKLLLESLKDHDEIPDTHYWNVMYSRYEAHPHRFREYHPTAAKLFREFDAGFFRLPVVTPPTGVTVSPAPAPGGGPAAVPEPPSLTLVTITIVAFLLARKAVDREVEKRALR